MTVEVRPNIDISLVPILESVSDPEIPVLSVLDMGVIREAIQESGIIKIKLTPTYSGCPAMDVISDDLKEAFSEKGKTAVESCSWT